MLTFDILAVHAFSVIYFVHFLFVTLSLQGVVLAPILSFHTCIRLLLVSLRLMLSVTVICRIHVPSSVRHRRPDVRHRSSRERFRPFLRLPCPCALRCITPSDPIGTTSYSVASTFAWEYISPRRTRPVRHHPKTCCELVAHLTTFSFHFTPLFGVVEAYQYLSSA